MDLFAQVNNFYKAVLDRPEHPESTSQAEHAGSIPIVSSNELQFSVKSDRKAFPVWVWLAHLSLRLRLTEPQLQRNESSSPGRPTT
jgi:hypothetical protein